MAETEVLTNKPEQNAETEFEKENDIVKEAAKQVEKKYPHKYKIIKARFKTNKIIAYGAFLIIIDSETQALNKINVQVSLRGHFYDELVLSEEWYKYDAKLIAASLKIKEINQGVTNGLKQVLKISFETRSFISGIIKNFNNDEPDEIKNTLRERILDVISDATLIMEIDLESVEKLEVPEDPNADKQRKTISDYEDEARNYIDIELVHDPVNGVQIKDLQEGQRVFVQNVNEEIIEKYKLQETSSYRDGKLFPAFVEMKRNDNTDESGEWTAIFNFGGGVYGKVNIYPIVKIKIFQEHTLIVEQALSTPAMDESERKEVLKMYLIFLGILTIFGLIVVWYYKYGVLLLIK